jgi:hypothetical protein
VSGTRMERFVKSGQGTRANEDQLAESIGGADEKIPQSITCMEPYMVEGGGYDTKYLL